MNKDIKYIFKNIINKIKIRKKFFIGIIFFIIGIIQLYNFVFISSVSSTSIAGFDIYYLNENQNLFYEYTALIAMTPVIDNNEIIVNLLIEKNNSEYSFPNHTIIYFPGITTNYKMLVPLSEDSYLLTQEEVYKKSRIDISKDIKIYNDPILGSDLQKIIIDTNQIDNFSGIIEFTWIEGLQEYDFRKYRIDLPFNAPQPDRDFTKISKYQINFLMPKNHKMDSSVPSDYKLVNMLGHDSYSFEINPGKTKYLINFSNVNADGFKNLFLIIFSILFGIGLTFIVEEFVISNKN